MSRSEGQAAQAAQALLLRATRLLPPPPLLMTQWCCMSHNAAAAADVPNVALLGVILIVTERADASHENIWSAKLGAFAFDPSHPNHLFQIT
jgi:hypothetical protein